MRISTDNDIVELYEYEQLPLSCLFYIEHKYDAARRYVNIALSLNSRRFLIIDEELEMKLKARTSMQLCSFNHGIDRFVIFFTEK